MALFVTEIQCVICKVGDDTAEGVSDRNIAMIYVFDCQSVRLRYPHFYEFL